MKGLAFFLFLFGLGLGTAFADDTVLEGLAFHVPAAWESVPPSSPVRIAEWQIPNDENGNGSVVVLHFGPGQGGDNAANLARWASTVTTPQGTPATPHTTTRSLGVINVTQIEVYGTYNPALSPAPGFPSLAHEHYGLVGVILDYPGEPLYVCFTGPEALVKGRLAAFTRFIDSAHRNRS